MADELIERAKLVANRCGDLASKTPVAGEPDQLWWERQAALRDAADKIIEMIAAWNHRIEPEAADRGDVWQPIEIAPHNRKVLVAYRNVIGNWRVVTACYHTQLPWSDDEMDEHESEYAPEGWYEESDSHDTILRTSGEPTAWQPLPDPPAIQSLRSEQEGGHD